MCVWGLGGCNTTFALLPCHVAVTQPVPTTLQLCMPGCEDGCRVYRHRLSSPWRLRIAHLFWGRVVYQTGQGSFETTVYLARSSRSAGSRWVYVNSGSALACHGVIRPEPVMLDLLPTLLDSTKIFNYFMPPFLGGVLFPTSRCVDLMDGVTACLLCGAVPSLNDIQTSLVERTWVNAQETLTAAKANFPHNVPAALGSLPNGLVGMLIVNTRAQWSVEFTWS